MKTHYSRNSKKSGLTLVELLVSAALLGAILLFSAQYFAQTSQLNSTIVSQATLQEELRNAGNIITDEIQRAVYVFPPCGIYSSARQPTPTLLPGCTGFAITPTATTLSLLNVSWSRFTMATTGNITKRPDDGTYVWEVGRTPNAPILAMIVAPYNPSKPCDAGSGNTNDGGCYQFVAYYPVRREQVTRGFSGNNATSGDLLDVNSNESSQWVIMEYRRRLSANLYYDLAPFTTSFDIPGVGTMTSGALVSGLILGPVVPTRWRDAGCDLNAAGVFDPVMTNWICEKINRADTSPTAPKYPSPDPDPRPTNQESPTSLPAIAKGSDGSFDLVRFSARMAATVRWINDSTPRGTSRILVENIRPTDGFSVEFTTAGMDERGATEVRLRLQGELNRGGQPVRFPAQPLEFFSTPRNIAP